MKRIFFYLIITLASIYNSYSQNYAECMQQGKYYFNKQDYISALERFDLAYESAENEIRKKDAQNWKNNSFKHLKTQQKKLEQELKSNTDALKDAQKLVNAFYFYDGKIALAYNNGKYGYINKNGALIIPYKYKKATHFEESTGFASAERDGQHYLIDTTGREYLLANNSQSLNGAVEALDLRNQHLSELPKYVFNYVKLKVLLISGNNLTLVPNELINLKELTHLDASNNKIQTLPSKIGGLLNLTKLSLRNNFITELPEDIVFVKRLTKLDLTNNKLYSLPNNMGSLYYLNELQLDGNNIKSLPSDLGQLRSLKTLSLRNNSLEKIPTGLSSLYRLENLYLDQNEIKDLPSEISRLSELRNLYLSRNRLGYLPIEIKQLTSLEHLDLQGNLFSDTKKNLIENWLPNCTIQY